MNLFVDESEFFEISMDVFEDKVAIEVMPDVFQTDIQEKEENKFTPSTLIEELEKENNLFKNRYNIDNSILKMIQLKLIKNFDSLTKAYEELLEHKNKCVFGKCLDAIICKE